MAKIQIGAPLTGIRGTVGGIVFSANASGPYAKILTKPITRFSAWQMPFRQQLSQTGYHWDNLSAPDRADWVTWAAAPTEPDYDPWGVQRYITGFQWYARCAQRRLFVDATWPSTAPSGAQPAAITGLTVTAEPFSLGNSEISWTTPNFGATDVLYATFATSTHPYSVFPTVTPLVIAASPAVGAGPIDVSLIIAIRFGEIISGQKAFVTAWNQNELGVRSVAAYATCLIA
jgi:hypothetical protein